MTQEKMRTVITAFVVAATTLLVVLFGVLVYQWIKIGVLDARINEAEQKREQLLDQKENYTNAAEYYESELGLEWLAHSEGWFRP